MSGKSSTESPLKALLTALGVAMVCALLVSVAAVTLRPWYEANLQAERVARLASILNALTDVTGNVSNESIEARVVNLDTGEYDSAINASTYDARKAAGDPAHSSALPAKLDSAGLKRRANHAVIYLVQDKQDKLAVMILPVRGVGYQSALYGYLALAADANEILALRFYEQGETPGLGSRITDPAWESLWRGKQAYTGNGDVGIEVGGLGHGSSSTRVDGISGATRTTQGVNALIRFWLGEHGFKPFLDRIRHAEI
ncbi:MAG: Na+-transporting NADH:ubiquinone oxidoreductase subunit C [Parasphingorhabdus sp.]